MKTTLFLFFFCFPCFLYAQLPVIHQKLDKYSVVDTMICEITYELQIVNDPQKPKELTKDIQTLQIGKRMSKTFSRLLFQADSTATQLLKKGAQNVPMFQDFVPPVIVYKKKPTGKFSTIYRTFGPGPIFEYEEETPVMKWNLHPEKKKIHNYNCQRATTTFRGRTYEAWFASALPFKDGPYKFHGLPGLILQLSDSQSHYVFSCIGIRKCTDPILYWKWKIQKTKKNEVDKAVKRMYKSPADFMESVGSKLKYIGMSAVETKKITYPFNPIELE